MKKIKLLRPKKLAIKNNFHIFCVIPHAIPVFLNIIVTDNVILSNCYFSIVLLHVGLVGYFNINSCNRNDIVKINLYLNRWTLQRQHSEAYLFLQSIMQDVVLLADMSCLQLCCPRQSDSIKNLLILKTEEQVTIQVSI